MIPSVGRIVIYNLYENEKAEFGGNHKVAPDKPSKAPAIITAVWGTQETSAVNLKVFTDSGYKDAVWVTSRTQGTGPGQWQDPREV